MPNPEDKFAADQASAIQASYESVSIRTSEMEKATADNIAAIAQLGMEIDKLTDSVSAQGQSTERLERAVTNMVEGINAQRETMQQMMNRQSEFLKLATLQAQIIRDQKAA